MAADAESQPGSVVSPGTARPRIRPHQPAVKLIRDKQVFALPKGRKTRTVPLSEEPCFLLAEHIKRRPPLAVTLPWEVPAGKPVLLDAGESIKVLSEYLGHADAGFTPRTYTHLMPSSEARTRRAVDRMIRVRR
jgi:integrase